MDQIFPRLLRSPSAKTRYGWVYPSVYGWLLILQVVAMIVLAITPFWISRVLGELDEIARSAAPDAITIRLSSLYIISFNRIATNAIILYIVAWIYLGCSLCISHIRQDRRNSASLAVSLASGSICLAATTGISVFHSVILLWSASLALAIVALIRFAFQFPFDFRSSRYQYFTWFEVATGIIFLGFSSIYWLFENTTPFKLLAKIILYVLICIALITFLAINLVKLRYSTRNSEKAQIRRMIVGAIFSFAPFLFWSGLNLPAPRLPLSPIYILPLMIFPIYASLNLSHSARSNYRTFLSQTITYALLSGLVVVAYVFLVTLISLAIGNIHPGANPALIGLAVFILAISLNPVRNLLQAQIDKIFLRQKLDYQDSIQTFTRELAQVGDLESIVSALYHFINNLYSPQIVHIFLYDGHRAQYCAAPLKEDKPTSDITFNSTSFLVRALAEKNQPIYLKSKQILPDLQIEDRARAALLGAVLFSPFPGQKQLTGWLALGARQSGEPYHEADIAFIDALCRQAALAIERAQGIINLEHRIRELDVLTRIAQGVNITLEFDDILELIYAQTINLIPSNDFRITLRSPQDNRCYHAICVEADERIAYNENVNLPPDQGLEQMIINNQRAYITEDYLKECRTHGVSPDANGVIAWIGVPLNAGSETIGAISLGSRNPNQVFSQHDLEILQAIADQAAGAIVKAQLLVEAEKRTRQLNKLNAVARSLSSTLDINPLLKQIMNSAVEILNCEAGSLVMLDEHTGELVFEVTVGPVASDLAGIRLPPGTGVAGKVIQSGEPMIANNASQNQDWFAQSDKETGFFTRDILAVPMSVKDEIIGVIEVINKLDGSPFSKDDLDFLSTFASQAAIAIENARLYTQTDQALSARLEEMSVLQRIDRELNTSLDVERAMSITLDWSLNQTGADAGLIGFVEQKELDGSRVLRIIETKGYPTKIIQGISQGDTTASIQPQIEGRSGEFKLEYLDLPGIQQAIRSGQPVQNEFYLQPEILDEIKSAGNAAVFQPEAKLLPQARSQIVIPIRRKMDVIALLFLESSKPDTFTQERVTFLTRLSDHAAIAISNAQLYADLQAANIAKSEFVSLVSHELKTPMTSIRGYADLLAQGTVGPINEIQANFLNTIRANVNRMANLVSDLADVSRIEAGRLRLEFGSISLSAVVEDVVKSSQALINEKEQLLHLVIPEELPNVWGDYNRLIQIMNNLVSNAIKYTPVRGQITISADHSHNVWDPSGAPHVVHVWVSDTGYGISSEDKEKIFQKFFRSSDPNIRELPGTGLGLNITRHLVEMQGGRIWFESAVNKGTTFHFTIPVSAAN